MSACFCDYDPPSFCNVTIRAARKLHACYECGGKILPGERYEYIAGKWDGLFDTMNVCERCHDIRQWVQNNGLSGF